MSKSLYEEAIEAAEQIKFAAEEKVKEKLVESMSPRIKDMVEKTFIKESMSEEIHSGVEPANEYGMPEADDEKQDECGVMELDEDDAVDYFLAAESDETNEISENAKNIFSKLVTKNNRKLSLEQKLHKLKESVKTLQKALLMSENVNVSKSTEKRFLLIYKNLLNEAKSIKSNSIIKSDNTLLKEYLQIIKELQNMSRRRRTRSGFLNESLEDLLETNLFEEDGEEEPAEEEEADAPEGDADLDLDLGSKEDDAEDDAADAEDDDAEDDDELELDLGESEGDEDLSDLIRKFIDDAEPLLSSDSEEEGEEEEAVEEGRVFEVDEADLGCEGEEEDSQEDEHLPESHDRVLEIDENMLRREIARMKNLREGEAKELASHFGGGELSDEVFVDLSDEDLNVCDDQLGREDVPTPVVEAALRNAARKNRMLESKMEDYKKALRGMKSQLSEMNLFNAKLLYANKLMQNRDLSIKQQRNIVESLDEAKTLGEAKILFESLSKSLVKGTAKSGAAMNESASRSVIGGSSRPVSSAQPVNEGVALDRWATLAGIKK